MPNAPLPTTKKLGQLLVERGWITGEQLIRAIQSQRVVGGRLGTCLLEMDVLTEDHLLDALADQLHVRAARIEQLRGISEEILGLVPARVARHCQAVPFFASANDVRVATLNVNNLAFLDELSFCVNRRVQPHIANEVRIFEALEKYYGLECPRRYGHLLDRLNRSRYMWDESAKILLGASFESESGWAAPLDDRQLISAPAARAIQDLGQAPQAGAPVQLPEPALAPFDPLAPPQLPPLSPVGPPGPDQELSLEDVDQLLASQTNLQVVGEVILRYLAQSFSRAALFKARKGSLYGWMCRGESLDTEQLVSLEIQLSEPSAFLNLAQGAAYFRGPLAPMPLHRKLAGCWGGQLPRECMMIPIRIRERLVSVLYGDRGAQPLGVLDLEQLQRLAHKASMALELCILRKKIQSS